MHFGEQHAHSEKDRKFWKDLNDSIKPPPPEPSLSPPSPSLSHTPAPSETDSNSIQNETTPRELNSNNSNYNDISNQNELSATEPAPSCLIDHIISN